MFAFLQGAGLRSNIQLLSFRLKYKSLPFPVGFSYDFVR